MLSLELLVQAAITKTDCLLEYVFLELTFHFLHLDFPFTKVALPKQVIVNAHACILKHMFAA